MMLCKPIYNVNAPHIFLNGDFFCLALSFVGGDIKMSKSQAKASGNIKKCR